MIHGLAFAEVLSGLQLSAGKLALSILGFNAGIELMQLFVIVLIIPWLMLLSKTTAYKYLRPIGATLAGMAALAWIIERTTGKANFVTGLIETTVTQYAALCIAALAVVSEYCLLQMLFNIPFASHAQNTMLGVRCLYSVTFARYILCQSSPSIQCQICLQTFQSMNLTVGIRHFNSSAFRKSVE